MMNVWAYLIATVAFMIGIYVLLRLKKWKIGAWIVCLSLAVFLTANVNVHNLISVDDAFKYEVKQQVSAISNDVRNMQVYVGQSMVLTQQISQTVNLVTEVRKEFADVREMISELYRRTRTEAVLSTETNRLWFFDREDGHHVVIIRLPNPVIPGSVNATTYSPESPLYPVPPLSTAICGNMIYILFMPDVTGYKRQSYYVSYVIDPLSTERFEHAELRRDGHLYLDNTDSTWKWTPVGK